METRNKGKPHIVRNEDNGILFGYLESMEGQTVVLRDARCLYVWKKAASILELAITGPKDPDGCKFTVRVGEMTITGATIAIPCTDEAAAAIEKVPEWKA